MQSIIKGVLFTVLLGFLSVAVAQKTPAVAEQLSPRARIDKHMIKAELLHDAGKHKEALKVMEDSVLALVKEDATKFKLPDNFYFKRARVALSADSFDVAKDSAKKYINIKAKKEKKDQFYDDALRLLNEAERQDEVASIDSHKRLWRVVTSSSRDFSSWTLNTVEIYYAEIIVFALFPVLFFFFTKRLISKIIAIFKDRKALSIIIPAAIGIAGLVLPAGYHTYYAANYSTNNVFEERITNRHTQIDTLALKDIQKDIMDLVDSQKDIMDLVDSMQAREARLDSAIKALQDSVHANRHLNIIRAELDALRELHKE